MQEPLRIIEVPTAGTHEIQLLAVAFTLLMALAIGIELYRRRRQRRRIQETAWRHVDSVMQEKGLTEAERKLFREVIRRWSSDDPRKPISVRQNFNQVIASEMDAVFDSGDSQLYAERGAILRDIRANMGHDYVPLGQKIQSTRELYPSQLIWMAPPDDPSLKWRPFKTVAVDEAYFQARLDDSLPAPQFVEGAPVRCRLWREDDARYVFDATFVRKNSETGAFIFLHTNDLNRKQARGYYRVPHEQVTTVSFFAAPSNAEPGSNPGQAGVRMRARFANLSAGGFALIVPQPVPTLLHLRAILELDEGEPMPIPAKIVATLPLVGGRYLVRASFDNIADDARDRIERYVFRRQQPLLTAAE